MMPEGARFVSGTSAFRRVEIMSGMGGLGVFVRHGLVKPVSLVRSAVEATLTLLAMERRRWLSTMVEHMSS